MPYLGEISAIITAFFWAGTSMAFTDASIRIGSIQLNVSRMFLASFLLFLTIVIAQIDYVLSSTQIEFLIYSGIAGLVLGDTFLFKAFQLIGARLGMLMMALVPAISTILAFFFLDEYITAMGILGMIVTISGIALVILERKNPTGSKHTMSKIGIFYGFLGALGQASGLILAKFAFDEGHINGFLAAFIRLSSAVLILGTLAVLSKRFKNPIGVFRKDKKALTSTIIGTLFGPYFGITFSLIAIANTKVGIASTLMALVPVIMLPMVRYYYKEKLSWRAISGAFLAVTGVAVLFLR